jgi:hypothetical protein
MKCATVTKNDMENKVRSGNSAHCQSAQCLFRKTGDR